MEFFGPHTGDRCERLFGVTHVQSGNCRRFRQGKPINQPGRILLTRPRFALVYAKVPDFDPAPFGPRWPICFGLWSDLDRDAYPVDHRQTILTSALRFGDIADVPALYIVIATGTAFAIGHCGFRVALQRWDRHRRQIGGDARRLTCVLQRQVKGLEQRIVEFTIDRRPKPTTFLSGGSTTVWRKLYRAPIWTRLKPGLARL